MHHIGSGEPLQTLLSAISDPVCGLDTESRITVWNDAAAEQLGYPPSEVEEQQIGELLSLAPEDERRIESLLADVETYTSAKPPDRSASVTATTATGNQVAVELSTAGAQYGTVLLVMDLQPLSAREIDLTDELEVYRQAVEESMDMLAAADQNHRFLFANERYRKFHGIEDPVEGKRVADLLPIETYLWDVESTVDHLTNGESMQFETERQGPDGSVHDLDVRYYPIETGSGDVEGAVAALRDITELKSRARSLRESWETYSDLVEGIPDPIVVYRDGDIVEVNHAACRLLGYAEEDLRELAYDDVVYETGTSWIESRLGSEAGSVIFETEYQTRDGERLPVEVAANRMEYFGSDATLTVGRDLSDRREYQRELEAANARLEEFAAVVTQDLRNPLTVARGWTDIVQESGSLDGLSKVRAALDRMEEIIDYTYTLAQEGDSIGHLTEIELAEIVRQSFHAVQARAATLENEVGCTIEADHGRLSYLFEMLFENSIERANTAITIRVDQLANGPGFYVTDDGPKPSLVDQPSTARSAHLGGSGTEAMDMSAVRRIANAHGWHFRIRNGADGGARFEFHGVETCTTA